MVRLADFHFAWLAKSYDYTYIVYTGENQNMVTKTRSNITENDLGKCICVSFPLHETALIEDLDHLANQEYVSRSQYIRRLIRREKQTNNNVNWRIEEWRRYYWQTNSIEL